MNDVAVALIIFNRPETTRRVFEAVKAAKPARLYIIADGPRKEIEGESARCAEARAVVEDGDWGAVIKRNYADSNMGCKDRISSGLEWVFANEEQAIILEDDCVPHSDFFPYCGELLARYRDDERVMMITGTNFFPADNEMGSESYFFSKHYSVWGWASWRRAWVGYDKSLATWRVSVNRKELYSVLCNRRMSCYLAQIFDRVKEGDINTWDYQWTYHCLLNGGLAITPARNLVSNVGVEGLHTRGRTKLHNRQLMSLKKDSEKPTFVIPNWEYNEYVWRMVDRVSAFRIFAGAVAARIRRSSFLYWSYPVLKRIFRASRL